MDTAPPDYQGSLVTSAMNLLRLNQSISSHRCSPVPAAATLELWLIKMAVHQAQAAEAFIPFHVHILIITRLSWRNDSAYGPVLGLQGFPGHTHCHYYAIGLIIC